ncbi:MAG TPA: transglutaminase-like domain-containing protein [Dongiaceae bacterium]|nr:transglutaminase-like domain-containing protein [Dongiaceae bacterium]
MTSAPSDQSPMPPAAYLQAIGAAPDRPFDLAEAALCCAVQDRPEVDLASYRRHLATLAEDLRQLAKLDDGASADDDSILAARVDMLRNVLAARHGYRGDDSTYDDLQNADLTRVIDRRRGLPVALAILYIQTARALGWQIEGVNFPGHFLIRLRVGSQAAILDPFDQGAARSIVDLREKLKALVGEKAELKFEHSAAVGDRDVLLRLQNNIKLRLVQEGDLPRAAAVLERMLWIAPDQATLWRESGLIHHRLGHLARAKAALQRFLSFDASVTQRHQAARLLQEIDRQLN